jgi:hypothetical protein
VDLEKLIESVQLLLKAASRRRPVAPARVVAELTMLAARHVPMASLRCAGSDEEALRTAIEHWEQVVYSRYAFRKARRFSTASARNSTAHAIRLIVMIVWSLVHKKKLDIEKLHQSCGWE